MNLSRERRQQLRDAFEFMNRPRPPFARGVMSLYLFGLTDDERAYLAELQRVAAHGTYANTTARAIPARAIGPGE